MILNFFLSFNVGKLKGHHQFSVILIDFWLYKTVPLRMHLCSCLIKSLYIVCKHWFNGFTSFRSGRAALQAHLNHITRQSSSPASGFSLPFLPISCLCLLLLTKDFIILSPFHSGDRSNVSIKTALLKCINDIFASFNRGQLTGAIFICLSKTFDNHSLDRLFSI